MRAIREFPDVDPSQIQTLAFDFGDFLPSGTTLVGTYPTTLNITCTVIEGVDPSPQNRLLGTPQVGTVTTANGGSGVSSAAVLQQFGGGQPGVEYLLVCVALRSDGDTISMWNHIKCAQPV